MLWQQAALQYQGRRMLAGVTAGVVDADGGSLGQFHGERLLLGPKGSGLLLRRKVTRPRIASRVSSGTNRQECGAADPSPPGASGGEASTTGRLVARLSACGDEGG
uniref:Uncharacterized protein n=1 Tax=Streptomyces avermitilis TaxID=33903 RepID=A0A499VP36_STRAX|nr:hypothetical protein SAVMC3_81310 [Streptomyces avermitilis]